MVLSPKESGKFIAENADFVKIKLEKLDKLGDILIEEINSGKLEPGNSSQAEVHPKSEDPYVLDWLLVVDTLNFCFWHNEKEEGWKVEGYSGYFALCVAINRAMKEKIDVLNPTFYSTITEDQLKKILRSDTKVDVPLLPERVNCLHEIGATLLKKFNGSFETVVKKSDNSAKTLLNLIVDNFKCFRDEAEFKGKQVSFYKRAQILVGDIWASFKGQGMGYFKDIDDITMFADYRVPQSLVWHGIMEYNDDLNNMLKSNTVLENGNQEEQEIRGCSIHAVELLKEYINKKLEDQKINSILIDHFLWDFRRKHAEEIEEQEIPFHKVFCIYY